LTFSIAVFILTVGGFKMADLKTTYMGIGLANPFIAGASDLTADLDTLKKIEDAGAGAVVLKSLFEEQIQLERFALEEDEHRGEARYAEMATIFPRLKHAGPKEHLLWVKKAKERLRIPVIASLNAVKRETWMEYARLLADQGVDGLELNFFAVPRDAETPGARIEEEQLEVVSGISELKIPFAVKLSPFYSNPLNFMSRAVTAGARALVLFNRFFHPDIDPVSGKMTQPLNLSSQTDNRLPLRYTGLMYGAVDADVCAGTGIMRGADAAKMILAGAAAVQTVSALYRRGIGALSEMREELSAWMRGKGHASLADFRGSLSQKNCGDPWAYTRAQYAKLLLNPKEFMEPVRT
jgi:dihydroorotate dehydrogenase (fumarate)